jgi:2-iminobutanoate/2-iminopropanoate deaminase
MTQAKQNTVEHIVCDGIPKPLPIYTHATIHSGIVYVSSIQGFLPGTLDFPSDAAADQTRQVIHNLKLVLEAAGSNLTRVLKIVTFMTDMRDFIKINEVINEAFPESPPARSSIAVRELPHDAKVVIEVIAAVNEG